MADYSNEFSESKFWDLARRVGIAVLRPALELYYAFRAPETPTWAKAIALGALGYFVMPFDAVPDILPGIGFVDDVATMGAAITSLGRYVTPEIMQKAEEKAKEILR